VNASRFAERAAVAELVSSLGPDKVATDPAAVARMLRDQSWLSPVLREAAAQSAPLAGDEALSAAVAPASTDELITVAAWAARHRVPLTVRGAATSNFGLLAADHGGIVVDMRSLRAVPTEVQGKGFAAPAGTAHSAFERAANDVGREMPVLTTTHATATIGGWLAGGHVGLGSGCHGAIWDGLVRSLTLVTLQERPELVTLHGAEMEPVLHTFGAGGLIANVVLESAPKHAWVEALGCFDHYEQAAQFVTELSLDRRYEHRAATAQDAGLTPGLDLALGAPQTGSVVLLIVDDAQFDDIASRAHAHGGRMVRWQPWTLGAQTRPSIAKMVYGHRMLWIKRRWPSAGFVHVYFDPKDPLAGQRALRTRVGDGLLMETKFIRSPWMSRALDLPAEGGELAASVVTVLDGTPERIHGVLAACAELGLKVQNSHTNVVEENGLFKDVGPLVRHKERVDPYNLVNPGRLRSATRRP
jgi:FAD/FMN-containing dehydrogenase